MGKEGKKLKLDRDGLELESTPNFIQNVVKAWLECGKAKTEKDRVECQKLVGELARAEKSEPGISNEPSVENTQQPENTSSLFPPSIASQGANANLPPKSNNGCIAQSPDSKRFTLEEHGIKRLDLDDYIILDLGFIRCGPLFEWVYPCWGIMETYISAYAFCFTMLLFVVLMACILHHKMIKNLAIYRTKFNYYFIYFMSVPMTAYIILVLYSRLILYLVELLMAG